MGRLFRFVCLIVAVLLAVALVLATAAGAADNGNKKRKQEMTRRCNSAVTVRVPDGGTGGVVVPFPPAGVAVPFPPAGVAVPFPREVVAGQEPQPLTIRWADPPNGVQRVCQRVRGAQGK